MSYGPATCVPIPQLDAPLLVLIPLLVGCVLTYVKDVARQQQPRTQVAASAVTTRARSIAAIHDVTTRFSLLGLPAGLCPSARSSAEAEQLTAV